MQPKLNLPKTIPQPPPCPEGYHYVDRGYAWSANNVMFNCFYHGMWTFSGTFLTSRGDCTGDDNIYYVEVVKDLPTQNDMTFEQQLAKANALIGKFVINKNDPTAGKYIIDYVKVYVQGDTTTSFNVDRYLKTHDFCVAVENKFKSIHVGDAIEITSIVVNGYTAEFPDNHNVVKFGCAEIHKYDIAAAIKLLETNTLGNRKFESVKIGAADFDLKTLKEIYTKIV